MSLMVQQIDTDIYDRVENKSIKILLRLWETLQASTGGQTSPEGLPDPKFFDANAIAWCWDNIMLVDPGPDGRLRYTHYGRGIAEDAGFDMEGRHVDEFSGDVSAFFQRVYRQVAETLRPLYTIHHSRLAVYVHAWERLILPVAGVNGAPYRLVVFNMPISRRANILESVLAASAHGILHVAAAFSDRGDPSDFNVIMTNGVFEAACGYDDKESIGKSVFEMLPSLREGRYRDLMISAMADRKKVSFETSETICGSHYHFEITVVATDSGLTLSIYDVTRIASAQDRLMDAIESLNAGFRLEDETDGTVIANSRYWEMFSIYQQARDGSAENPVSSALARSQIEVPDEDREAWLSVYRPGTGVAQAEVTFRAEGGAWIRSAARRTGASNIVELHTDVTVLKEAEAAAEAANRSKSAFLAMMSHEIRTPLGGVTGMLQLMDRRPLEPEMRRLVDVALESGAALATIVDDVLDFSKLEADRMELQQVPFDPIQVVSHCVDLFAPKAAAKGLKLACCPGPLAGRAAVGDPDRVRQIVNNLLSNAVKFTDTGGIVVEVRLVGTGVVEFDVTDTGIGLRQDEAQQLFREFVQVDSSRSRRHYGTGLGLAICRRLLDNMGGAISVESQPGEGSRFRFTLPVDRPTGPTALVPQGTPILGGRRVLLIDDLPIGRDARMRQLAVLGAEVVVPIAVGAEPGSVRVPDGPKPDLIIIDCVDAGEPARALQEASTRLWGGEPPPCILIEPAIGTTLLETSFRTTLLSRPVRPEELQSVCGDLLGAWPDDRMDRTRIGSGRADRQLPMPSQAAEAAPILIAEDNAANQMLLRMTLESQGYRTVIVDTGQAALDALAERAFGLLLMDITMPGMDGLTAIRALREMAHGRSITAIAVSAHAYAADRAEFLDAGFDDYVSKPIDLDQLIERVSKWYSPFPVIPDRAGPGRSNPGKSDGGKADGGENGGSASDAGEPVVNQRRLDELEALLGPNGTAALIREALGTIGALLPDETGFDRLAETDWGLASVHAVSGLAANMGATALHSRLQAIELRLRAGESLNGRDTLQNLAPLSAETIAELRRVAARMSGG